MISKEELKRIQDVSKLKFSNEELDYLTEEFLEIINLANQIKDAPTDGVQPTYKITQNTHPLREDKVKPSLPKEQVLKNAPQEQYGYFKLPSIID